MLWLNLILTPLSLVPALFVWRWPDPVTWLVTAGIGLLATLAHILLTRAYTKAEASAVVPFDYARLPFVALVAYLAFGEVVDAWTWVGAGIIAGSSIYIARREIRLARARLTAPPDRAGPVPAGPRGPAPDGAR